MSKQINWLYEFGSFRLDHAERLLLRHGEPVPMTAKVFDLLLLLVQRSGQLVTKEEIIAQVWPDRFVDDANLTVNISALRKALGEDRNETKYVETVPKIGYRFVANVREVPTERGGAAAAPSLNVEDATAVQVGAAHQPGELSGVPEAVTATPPSKSRSKQWRRGTILIICALLIVPLAALFYRMWSRTNRVEPKVGAVSSEVMATVPPLASSQLTGIVGWWKGEGDANDSGGVNRGALHDGALFALGKFGYAFSFDGEGAYMQASAVGLPVGKADRTLELWTRVDFYVAEEAFLVGYGNFGAPGQTYHLGTWGGRLFFSSWGTGLPGPPIELGKWYHVAATNEGDFATLYVNGKAFASGTVVINTAPDSQLYMGRIPGRLGDIRRLNGIIEEVKIYNRALTAAEIQDIVARGM